MNDETRDALDPDDVLSDEDIDAIHSGVDIDDLRADREEQAIRSADARIAEALEIPVTDLLRQQVWEGRNAGRIVSERLRRDKTDGTDDPLVVGKIGTSPTDFGIAPMSAFRDEQDGEETSVPKLEG